VLANWMGGKVVKPARALLETARVPSFDTPGAAVGAYMQLTGYRRLQTLLAETPPAEPDSFSPDRARARAVIDAVLADNRSMLTEAEAKDLLDAYRIPIVVTAVAGDADEAVRLAEGMGYPVAVKILSRQISHKSDVGGVTLNLKSADAVRQAVLDMTARVAELRPGAVLDGFTVQQMVIRSSAHELLVGAFVDEVFGPVIMFGQGGVAVEVIRDRAVALPPLNMAIAGRLIGSTRISRLLQGYRDRPRADLDAVMETLLKVAQLVGDFAEVGELDINPLLADDKGVIALDARVVVRPSGLKGVDRLAICPYPVGLEEQVVLRTGEEVLLRPIRPEDEAAHAAFFAHLDDEDVRMRFMTLIKPPDHDALARFTQIDYDREMSFIATRAAPSGPETLGVVRTTADPDGERAEYAIIVRSDMKGAGLGYLLTRKMIDYCRGRGLRELFGMVLAENQPMRRLAGDFGFAVRPTANPAVVEIVLAL
jgi:acetyltransferase